VEQRKNSLSRINAAFCFDENLISQVQAAVASLLDAESDGQVHYDIYCVCTREAARILEAGSDEAAPKAQPTGQPGRNQNILTGVVNRRDPDSTLHLCPVENPYADSYQVRGISAGTYLRLMLHRLLPQVDKILYLDVDVLIRESLLPIWETNLQGKVLAAVKGAVNLQDKWEWNSTRPYWHLLEGQRGQYINAGVTLMNLAEIRALELEKQWDELAAWKLYYQDQDILNITCQGRILYLPPRYNRLAYMTKEDYNRFVTEKIFTAPECAEALERPVIIHYAGDKPWKRYDTNLGSLWWDYVNSQDDIKALFDEKKARSYHGPTLWERGVRKLQRIFGGQEV
jgi:lipopolysaccharide biosynthesis glycosyltransferase